MSLSLLSIFLLIPLITAADESCRTECFPDKMPMCGVWMINETTSQAAGIYELNTGLLNMSCVFSSLPEPPSIQWMYKAQHMNTWAEFSCSNKDERKQCSETEHRVSSRCLLRVTDLNQSGNYRCQGVGGNANNNRAFGSEFPISVHGIGKVEVKEHQLAYGKMGNIVIEVCSNPKPDVFWLVNDIIMKAYESQDRFSTTHLHHKQARKTTDGPAALVPYCYHGELFISNVHENDTFGVIVRTEAHKIRKDFNLKVTEVPPKSAALPSYLILSLVALLKMM